MRLFQVALRAAARSRSVSTSAICSTGGKYPNSPRYKAVQQLQSAWAVDDGKLVWQKRGARDKLPYLATLALVLSGIVYSTFLIKVMSFPRKKEE